MMFSAFSLVLLFTSLERRGTREGQCRERERERERERKLKGRLWRGGKWDCTNKQPAFGDAPWGLPPRHTLIQFLAERNYVIFG